MKKRKEEAEVKMLAKLEKEWLAALENISDMWDDSEDPETNRLQGICEEWINGKFYLIRKLIKALLTCILLTLEFNLSVSAQRCFCPCGKKMQKWRELVKCEFKDQNGGCRSNKQGHFDNLDRLITHLNEKSKVASTYQLHEYVLQYLKIIYWDQFF